MLEQAGTVSVVGDEVVVEITDPELIEILVASLDGHPGVLAAEVVDE